MVTADKEITPKKEQLVSVIQNLNTEIEITPIVRIGSIFEDIGNVAAEYFSEMIFMGTHGATGWQHIVGSHALRVVTNSPVPFVIVQEKNIKPEGYKNIIVPLDLAKETKQKLVHVANLAKYFNSKIHVVTIEEKDASLVRKMEDNIYLTKTFLEERGIEYTTHSLNANGFDKEIVKHAIKVDADLIAIMNLNQQSVFGILSANYEQYIITNDAKIPTLIVNPIESKYGTSFLMG